MSELDNDNHAHARAQELDQVRAELARLTAGHKVLELGCGHGAAGEGIVPGATCVVTTGPTDLPAELGGFGAVFMGFGWSHLKREEQEPFLKQLRARMGKDVLLILLDETYVEGSSPTIARTDAQGNTYHVVNTPDGTQAEQCKSYPTDSTLRKRLADAGREIRIQRWDYYWLLSCRLK
jgi:hypothetical protein